MINVIDVAIIKPNAVVFYKDFEKRNYNEKSKHNLKQNTTGQKNSILNKLSKTKKINDINAFSEVYQTAYKQKTQKNYFGTFSKNTANNVYKIASIFTNAIIKNYVQSLGFKQRVVTFSTFTLSDAQKHSDKQIIKTFVEFIDHLKKVDNYILGTKEKAPNLKNYVWRAETQDEGNIHFHLIADCYLNKDNLKRLWNSYLIKLGYPPHQASCKVESLKKDKQNNKILDVNRYLSKYMTKPPLKKEYEKLSQKDAEKLYQTTGINPFRRPVIGRLWGCSHNLKQVDFPKFYDWEINELQTLKQNLKEYKSATLPDFINVFIGNVKNALKKCTYQLQGKIKQHYRNIANRINGETIKIKIDMNLIWKKIQSFCKDAKMMLTPMSDDEALHFYKEIKRFGFNVENWFAYIHQKQIIENTLAVHQPQQYYQTSLFN